MSDYCDVEMNEAEESCRASLKKNAKRLVIKVGTSSLTHDNGSLNLNQVERLCRVLADLRNLNYEVILVTSGAIAVGISRLRLTKRPTDLRELQAVAAVGQTDLMSLYRKFLSEYNQVCGQILLTRDDVDDDITKMNLINTFEALLDAGVIPIVNENDSVSTTEVMHNGTFGDNDMLSAIVAELVHADVLLLLSDVSGLYQQDPRTLDAAEAAACFVSYVKDLSEVRHFGGGAGSGRGTGGMQSKLSAAEICQCAGLPMLILAGDNPRAILDILRGERQGTIFDVL